MLMSRHQNAGKNHNMKIVNRSLENVAHIQIFGMTVTNQNLINEEIKRRVNQGNASYHSIQNLLPFRLLSENVKISTHKNYNFACCLV
jgi:hypothetical protein